MSRLWRAATSPTHEDVARHVIIRNSLTQGFSNSVKKLQVEHLSSDDPIKSNDTVNAAIYYLEAIFLHGIRNSLSEKFNSFFSGNSDKVPQPHFWNLATIFSHNDVTCQINHLTQISTDIGRSRAWIRIALNDGLIESYIKTMIKDTKSMKTFYKPEAYLRDNEQPDILISIIEGLNQFTFKLSYNSRVLNSWTSRPLILCGLWTPAMALDPVMPGVDVAKYFEHEGKKDKEKPSAKNESSDDVVYNEVQDTSRPRALAVSAACVTQDQSVGDSDSCNSAEQLEFVKDELSETGKDNLNSSNGKKAENKVESWVNINPNVFEAHDVDSSFDVSGTSPSVGNSLAIKSGWSSPFDGDTNHVGGAHNLNASSGFDDTESFDSLLNSYNQSRKQAVIIGTPNSSDLVYMCGIQSSSSSPPTSRDESDSRENLPKTSSPVSLEGLEYEVVPPHCSITSQNADARTQTLLSLISTISNEKGLDFQNYECLGCKRPVGMIYGKARVCHYDSCYYCFECHENDVSVIPSRILHNWDFQKYPVCKFTKAFLGQVEDEPLLDLRKINSQLYSIVEELNTVQLLRTQLSYLRSYLFTCRESIAEAFRKRVWPKEYLFEHVHLFALSDLLNISNGALAQTLQKLVAFAVKHIHQCRLCSQKGFICEICNIPKVIYPFDLETTYRCEACLAVYHTHCMLDKKPCPKCERRRRRNNDSEDFSLIE